jgi:hypothetical protein
MPEGRIQFCRHHTPQLLWQPRWLSHPNAVCALQGVVIAVADLIEAAERYARFTGLAPRLAKRAWHIETAHGYVLCAEARALRSEWCVDAPVLPWIAGAILATRDMHACARYVRAAGCLAKPIDGRLLVRLPAAVGGIMVFEPAGAGRAELQ